MPKFESSDVTSQSSSKPPAEVNIKKAEESFSKMKEFNKFFNELRSITGTAIDA